jgi:hypothetical protein
MSCNNNFHKLSLRTVLRRVKCYDMDVLGIRKYGRSPVLSLGLLSVCN